MSAAGPSSGPCSGQQARDQQPVALPTEVRPELQPTPKWAPMRHGSSEKEILDEFRARCACVGVPDALVQGWTCEV
jgi:hypothetical protein